MKQIDIEFLKLTTEICYIIGGFYGGGKLSAKRSGEKYIRSPFFTICGTSKNGASICNVVHMVRQINSGIPATKNIRPKAMFNNKAVSASNNK